MSENKTGFSLIELLIAVGVMGLLSLVIAQSLFVTLRSNTKTEILKEIKQNGDNAIETMTREVQNAQSIGCSGDSRTLTITHMDKSQTVIYADAPVDVCLIKYVTTNPAPTPAESGYYSSNNINLMSNGNCNEGITFTCAGNGNNNTSVTINFTLEQKGQPDAAYEKASLPFLTTVVMRNITY